MAAGAWALAGVAEATGAAETPDGDREPATGPIVSPVSRFSKLIPHRGQRGASSGLGELQRGQIISSRAWKPQSRSAFPVSDNYQAAPSRRQAIPNSGAVLSYYRKEEFSVLPSDLDSQTIRSERSLESPRVRRTGRRVRPFGEAGLLPTRRSSGQGMKSTCLSKSGRQEGRLPVECAPGKTWHTRSLRKN